MSEVKKYIAVDLGAESGRVMLGSVSDDKLVLNEIHRFSNGPIEENGSLRWDFDKLLSEIKAGISKTAKMADKNVAGIGVDSWGVDFGLLDADGKLITVKNSGREYYTIKELHQAIERHADLQDNFSVFNPSELSVKYSWRNNYNTIVSMTNIKMRYA